MAVKDKVKNIIVEQLGVDEEEVTEDASFVDDLGADSLDTVELVMALEEEFGLEIPDGMTFRHVLVIGLPTYNFGIPASLKAWVDQICRVGETLPRPSATASWRLWWKLRLRPTGLQIPQSRNLKKGSLRLGFLKSSSRGIKSSDRTCRPDSGLLEEPRTPSLRL